MKHSALKIAFGFLLGAIAGVVLAMVLRAPSEVAPREGVPAVVVADEEPKPSYQALLQRIAELESEIDALAVEGQVAGANSTSTIEEREQRREANRAAASLAAQRTVQQFLEQGFTVERAEWLQRRHEELNAELGILEVNPMHKLRTEIGDAEYERYLRATGRDPVVLVTGMLGSSQAAAFGFQRNDRITSYDGQRVFDHREIRLMEAQGEVGEPVIIEVIRDGQPMQLYIRRGSFDAGLLPAFPPLSSGR